jgi:pyrroline-5-carboxylate reductase
MGLNKRTIAFIGSGHITEIIIDNLINNKKIIPAQLIASDPDNRRTAFLQQKYDVQTAINNVDAVKRADIVFINVLPQVAGQIIDELYQASILKNHLIISLVAGISINRYQKLGEKLAVVRALPNSPSRIGMGITALAFNDFVSLSDRSDVEEIFTSFGQYVVIKEELINAVTALSTPANVYLFFQSLIHAGVREGIDRENATAIVYQTIVGSMEMWKSGDLSLAELSAQASTPGGVSVECLYTLEKNAFRAALIEAIHNGTQKAATFSK